MILPIESSMKERERFGPVLSGTIALITTIFLGFGAVSTPPAHAGLLVEASLAHGTVTMLPTYPGLHDMAHMQPSQWVLQRRTPCQHMPALCAPYLAQRRPTSCAWGDGQAGWPPCPAGAQIHSAGRVAPPNEHRAQLIGSEHSASSCGSACEAYLPGSASETAPWLSSLPLLQHTCWACMTSLSAVPRGSSQ